MNSSEVADVRPNLIIVYVDDPVRSADFYRALLNREPSFAVPTWVAFDLGAFTLGLWSNKRAAQSLSPAPAESGNRSEVVFAISDAAAVEQTFREWKGRGITILQEPMDDVLAVRSWRWIRTVTGYVFASRTNRAPIGLGVQTCSWPRPFARLRPTLQRRHINNLSGTSSQFLV